MRVPTPTGAAPAIVAAIRHAAETTGADFRFLMAEARRESGFDPDAKARGSSAAGLFQFIETTWLDMVRRHGAKHGVGALAEGISSDVAGRPRVDDPELRARILALRHDPKLSAALAGELAKSNEAALEKALGREASPADLYLAHFLGAGGAARFLRTVANDGDVSGAELLPEAAAANPAVFYDRSGRARSLAEIYRAIAAEFEPHAVATGPGPNPAEAPHEKAEEKKAGAFPPPRKPGLAEVYRAPGALGTLDLLTLLALRVLEREDERTRKNGSARRADLSI